MFYGNWEEIQLQDYNITFRELFPIVVAIFAGKFT